jgi:hypothetical protein
MKIDFEFTTQYGVFRDALYLDDNHTLSETEIIALQKERLDHWLYNVENPPQPEPEIAEIEGITYKKVNVEGQIVLMPLNN